MSAYTLRQHLTQGALPEGTGGRDKVPRRRYGTCLAAIYFNNTNK